MPLHGTSFVKQLFSMSDSKIRPIRPHAPFLRKEPDFSLVLGGPLYQLYLRSGLAQPPLWLLPRRVIAIPLICWLPLLLLTALAGRLIRGVSVPFLLDPEVQVKFLIALPMLIAAEVVVHERIRKIVGQFLERGMIARADLPRFEGIINSAMRLRNSAVMELLLLVLALALGFWMLRANLSVAVLPGVRAASWYADYEGGRIHFTAAGTCYVLVSLSIFRFILLRWYFRLFVWCRFLWQVRGMPLQLNFYHPDRAGGLGFLSASLIAFVPVFVSQTMVLAAAIYDRILYEGQKLQSFTMEIAGVLLLFALVAVVPLTFFVVHLDRMGRKAKIEFGAFASRYVNDFRHKWIQAVAYPQEHLLGSADIQSLADVAGSYDVVSGIGLLPITKHAFIRMMIVIALPLLPLVLTVLPLHEIIRRLFKVVL
jgi:hypothetical protein